MLRVQSISAIWLEKKHVWLLSKRKERSIKRVYKKWDMSVSFFLIILFLIIRWLSSLNNSANGAIDGNWTRGQRIHKPLLYHWATIAICVATLIVICAINATQTLYFVFDNAHEKVSDSASHHVIFSDDMKFCLCVRKYQGASMKSKAVYNDLWHAGHALSDTKGHGHQALVIWYHLWWAGKKCDWYRLEWYI